MPVPSLRRTTSARSLKLIAAYPLWAIIVIVVDVAVIFALTSHNPRCPDGGLPASVGSAWCVPVVSVVRRGRASRRG